MAKKKAASRSDENHEPEHQEQESIDFDSALIELEQIVRRLESGGTPLEDALQDYATAISLMKDCHRKLEAAERRIEVLSGFDAQGNPVTEPLAEQADDLDDKRSARSTRRSAPTTRRTARKKATKSPAAGDGNDDQSTQTGGGGATGGSGATGGGGEGSLF